MKLSTSCALALPAMASASTLFSRSVDCGYMSPASSGDTCDSFSSEWGLTVAQFVQLNPGVVCPGNLVANQNYCVYGTVSSASSSSTPTTTTAGPTTSKTTTKPTTTTIKTTTASPTTTSSAAHQPQQSGLASNCNNFYDVQSGDSCQSIEQKYGISAAQFSSWNPSINSQCTNLFSGYYVCVGVPGATTTPSTPTTTAAGNGITTPTPTQSGMVNNCNKFYEAQSGDTCSSITSNEGISLSQFYSWNPAVGSNCASLWAGYNYCVGVIGGSSTPTTTTTGSSSSTPSPVQSGIASNCDEYYQVQSGDTCSAIASSHVIPLSQFYSWNPAVGSSCQNLWSGYWVCTDVTGYTPPATTTSPGNGVSTPTPYEPGMVSNCNAFYNVNNGDTCSSIAQSQGITVQDIETWNPKVGSDCSDLYLHYYICTGVM